MSVYIAIITAMQLYFLLSAVAIASVTLWRVDSAAALKWNSNGSEYWLAGHLDKGSVHWREGPGM